MAASILVGNFGQAFFLELFSKTKSEIWIRLVAIIILLIALAIIYKRAVDEWSYSRRKSSTGSKTDINRTDAFSNKTEGGGASRSASLTKS